jgi:tetratricopeptide (TPR) repeat protein
MDGGGFEEEPEVEAREERWYLQDEREFLVRSIDDADREHLAGDLSEADHAVLVERDRHRLAEVESQLEALGPNEPAGPSTQAAERTAARMSEWRRVGIIAACFMIVAGVVILVDHALSPRLPGQASSGSITLPKAQLIEQQLDQAAALNNTGDVYSALKLYDKILAEDPDDPQALAASGWLDWNYGTQGDSPTLVALGRQDEEKAIRDAPSFFGGHLFLGLILLNQDHNAKAAVSQFTDFLADGPSIDEVQSVAADLRTAYVDAGVPVPPALAAPSG